MSLDDLKVLQGIGLGAGATFIIAISIAWVRIYGSGKERMDFTGASRKSLEDQLEKLGVQLEKAWAENDRLRTRFVGDLTDFEKIKDKIDDDKNAAIVQLAVCREENKHLLHQLSVMIMENARLLSMVKTPNVYPDGYFALPSEGSSTSDNPEVNPR